jgi:hypothetical protein
VIRKALDFGSFDNLAERFGFHSKFVLLYESSSLRIEALEPAYALVSKAKRRTRIGFNSAGDWYIRREPIGLITKMVVIEVFLK